MKKRLRAPESRVGLVMMFRKTQGKRRLEIRERRGAERRRAKGGRFALQASSAGIRPGKAFRGEGGRGGTRRSEPQWQGMKTYTLKQHLRRRGNKQPEKRLR